jgi:flagellar basal-body rod protein FlgG
LDTAINGRGYFQITLPNGDTAYTRAGAFQLSDTGNIVTVDGFEVQPNITIPSNATDITIDSTGQVQVKIPGQVAPQTVGQLQLATFANQAGLLAIGENLYLETPASGAPTTGSPGSDEFGKIQQGFLETSNVNVVEEVTNLITAQRAYEMNSKVIQTSDQMMATLSNLR